jgi:hypothetical protein
MHIKGENMNSVDISRILKTIKVEDGHILLGKPLEYEKYGVPIKINQINFYYKWDKMAYYLGHFFNVYNSVCSVLKLPENLDDLKTFQENIGITLKSAKLGKIAFKQVCKMAKLYGIKLRWAKKTWSLDDWIEFFVYVYLYNIAGQKKSLYNALELIKQVQLN